MTQPLYGYINQPKYLWLKHLKQKFYTRCLNMKSRTMINTNTTCLTMPSQTMNDQHTFNTKILNKKLFWLTFFDFTLIWKISYFLKWVLMNHPNIVALLWKKNLWGKNWMVQQATLTFKCTYISIFKLYWLSMHWQMITCSIS